MTILVKFFVFAIFVKSSNTFNDCGIPTGVITGFVYGGDEVVEGQWPWVVPLFNKNSGHYFCGSSIITNRHLLSAAHCFFISIPYQNQIKSNQIFGLYGTLNISNQEDNRWKRLTFQEINIHPDYQPPYIEKLFSKFDADISILTTKEEIQFSKFVKKICLPYENTNVFNIYGSVVGYGVTENSEDYESIPRFTKISTVDLVECLFSDEVYISIASKRSFCGGSKENLAIPCRGDSGGGFYVQEKDHWSIYGIVSAGQMKGTQCNAEKFVVFTNVALFLDWINSVLLCMTPICGNNRCEIEAISGRPECMVPPKFVNYQEDKINVTLGESLNFTCGDVTGNPKPYVYIIKNYLKASLTSELFIQSVKYEDSGDYKCIAENSEGKVEKIFTLEVQEIKNCQKTSLEVQYSEWTEWSECYGECESQGFQYRMRNCSFNEVKNIQSCPGDLMQYKPCQTCYSVWLNWNPDCPPCSKSGEKKSQIRIFICKLKNNANACKRGNFYTERRDCNLQPCI